MAWASFALTEDKVGYKSVVDRSAKWIQERAGGLDAATLSNAIKGCYGEDRTFSAPILTHCILSGRFKSNKANWSLIPSLPFEFSLTPFWCLKWLNISVVSYALPALIAIGQVRHHHCPTSNPLLRFLRNALRGKTLQVLDRIQPSNGGFLEATPLTSFVVMSLISAQAMNHSVVKNGLSFLLDSQREDGSWPIDTNLATWGTTLSINALAIHPDYHKIIPAQDRVILTDWLLHQQNRGTHPYTQAQAGGWAWTDLPGGVPDADDTSGALLALHHLGIENESVRESVELGMQWLLNLQNKDGGIPTFCRGWGKLPFDRSAPDLTAHFLTALMTWIENDEWYETLVWKVKRALRRGLQYLQSVQRKDGAWVPLWFGNPLAPKEENPVYGTSGVLSTLARLEPDFTLEYRACLAIATNYLLSVQNQDQGWGGAQAVPSSIEETALAVSALSRVYLWVRNLEDPQPDLDLTQLEQSLQRGIAWLLETTQAGTRMDPTPIGLYFARLWYFEKLYPLIFTTQALEQVHQLRECISWVSTGDSKITDQYHGD